jgi:hypothetical protein
MDQTGGTEMLALPRTIETHELQHLVASPDLAEVVHQIITSNMAEGLITAAANLDDDAACRAALLADGFGTTSVDPLLHRAIEAARHQKRGSE